MSSLLLKNKLAVVTGGSGTIGKAIAAALLKQGSKIVLTGRSLGKLQAVADELGALGSAKQVSCISSNVTQQDSVVALFDEIQSVHGGCHLLVNNAGTMAPGPTTQLDVSDFEYVMRVNVTGPFLCSREAFKHYQLNNTAGRIINIGSISAQSPRADSAPYTTSKFALQGLTQSLALDGRNHNISVGMISPGNVRSALLSEDEILRREGEEGFLEPEDVANCVVTMATLPAHANLLDLTVIPTRQPLVGRG